MRLKLVNSKIKTSERTLVSIKGKTIKVKATIENKNYEITATYPKYPKTKEISQPRILRKYSASSLPSKLSSCLKVKKVQYGYQPTEPQKKDKPSKK